MMAQAPTVLLLATFGLEVVECGGALARNADAGVGLALHHQLDRAFHLYHGAGHGRFLLAEPYRRQDLFHLDTLVV